MKKELKKLSSPTPKKKTKNFSSHTPKKNQLQQEEKNIPIQQV